MARILAALIVLVAGTAARLEGQTSVAVAPGPEDSPERYLETLRSLLDVKVITASRFSQDMADAPGVISVVTRDELRRFGGLTLREVLERVPGLTGATAMVVDRSLVAIRGDQTKDNGGHLLFLINGRPTREILEGGTISDLLEAFPVAALERIEVIKGPGSVLYGSNAFSGVINLITQQGDWNGIQVTGFKGQPGGGGGSARIAARWGDLSIFGAAQVRHRPKWPVTWRTADAFTADAPTLVENPSVRDRATGAYLGASYKGFSFMSSLTHWNAPTFISGTTYGENRNRRGFADLGYTFALRDGWDSSINLTYTRVTLLSPEPSGPGIHRDSHELLLEWSNTVTLSDRDRFIFGILGSRIRGRETYTGTDPHLVVSDGRRLQGSAYAQLEHEFGRGFTAVGGVQLNKIEHIRLDAVPRLGLIWNPAGRFTVKALFSEAFRAPSLNETNLRHPLLYGDPTLKPERVRTFDVAASYQTDRFGTSISYFHSDQTNSIIVVALGPDPPVRYANLGEAHFHGVEWESKHYLSQELLLTGSLLYQWNNDRQGARNIGPTIPAFGAKAGISYETPMGLLVSAFDSYQGALGKVTTTRNPRPSAYHLLTAHLRYDLSRHFDPDSRSRWAVFVHGDNLANRPVWVQPTQSVAEDSIPMHFGRALYFGIEFTFRED